MFDFILGNTVFTKAIIACCFIGILSWSVLTISYRSMIRATSRIGQTKKKWLVSLKKKYEDYHEMDIKVNNVETFVDKYFRKKRVCGLPCGFWKTLYRLTIAACAITGAAGALAVSQGGGELTSVIVTYLTGVIAAFGLIFLDILLRADAKEHRIIMNMNDYLQNVLENSIAGREVDLEDGTSREQRHAFFVMPENTKKKAKDEPVSLEEKKVLEDVLQEFLLKNFIHIVQECPGILAARCASCNLHLI